MVRLFTAMALAVAVSACVKPRAFPCAEDVDCGAGGQCEAVGFCSFTDPDCSSGRRYGELAGALASVCVGNEPDAGTFGDGGVDAGLGDGGVFLTCLDELEAGWYHQCLRKGGNVECWGENGRGQLGDTTYLTRSSPTPVFDVADAVDITAGGFHTCLRDPGNKVWCWGGNSYGQIDGTGSDHLEAAEVPTLPPLVAMDAGYLHTCGIDAGGEVWCWGANTEGQSNGVSPAPGSEYDPFPPTKLAGVTGAVEIAAAGSHTCARLTGGTVKCWGRDTIGQLGSGSTSPTARGPVDVDITGVVQLVAGDAHTCARKSDDTVWCWGSNQEDQLGQGSGGADAYSGPHQVTPLNGSVEVAVGHQNTCGRKGDGSVWCAGLDDRGQLGRGSFAYSRSTFAQVGLLPAVDAVSMGHHHTCARGGDGIYCWGAGGYGAVGDGALVQSLVPVATLVTTGAAEVATGHWHTCVRTSGGAIRCFGQNDYGQLGNGNELDQSSPVDTLVLTSGVTAISAGHTFSCALTSDKAYCWGANRDGYLGDDTMTYKPQPTQVFELTTAVELAAGTFTTCARKSDGAVVCWGDGSGGQIDGSTATVRLKPFATPIGAGATTAIGKGEGHSCAVVGGKVSCWGGNGDGELGRGTTGAGIFGADFVEVSAGVDLTGVLDVAGGYDHTCARTADKVYCWGDGYSGQLGNGAGPSAFAVEAKKSDGSSLAASHLAAYARMTCAIETPGGAAYCWGQGDSGVLGNGSLDTRNRVTPVSGGLTGLVSISVGAFHACAVTGGGALHCWGNNEYGQLGTGLELRVVRPRASLATCP